MKLSWFIWLLKLLLLFLFIFEKKNYLNPYVIYKVKVEVVDLLIDHTINYLIHKVKQLKHRYNIYHSNNKAIKKITLRFGNEVKNRKRASPLAKPFWGPSPIESSLWEKQLQSLFSKTLYN